jgi:glucose uptake protein
MYLPVSAAVALLMTVLTTVFWGSWANSFKVTRNYPFPLFYWDYIFGVVLCALIFAFTLGSHGSAGEPFLDNLQTADHSDLVMALVGGAVFNIANLLLVAATDIAGLAVAFPLAIGIAMVEGVVLSYALQPAGNIVYLGLGVVLAVAAVLFNARAYSALSAQAAGHKSTSRKGIIVSLVSGVLMGGWAPFVTRAMTHGHVMTPYSVTVLFAVGAFLCNLVVNPYFMKRPLHGDPVSFSGYWQAGTRNHLLGLVGGIAWGIGGSFNLIAAGLVGIPISYAIGQAGPLVAASWGIFVWHEFTGAPKVAWRSLQYMFALYIAAIVLLALAYNG